MTFITYSNRPATPGRGTPMSLKAAAVEFCSRSSVTCSATATAYTARAFGNIELADIAALVAIIAGLVQAAYTVWNWRRQARAKP